MNDQSDKMAIISIDLILMNAIQCNFKIATTALMQASANLGILGFDRTKQEIQEVIEDLRKAIFALDQYKTNEANR